MKFLEQQEWQLSKAQQAQPMSPGPARSIPALAQVCRLGQEEPVTTARDDSSCIDESLVAWVN